MHCRTVSLVGIFALLIGCGGTHAGVADDVSPNEALSAGAAVSTPSATGLWAIVSSNSNLVLNIAANGGELEQVANATPEAKSASWTFKLAADGSGSFAIVNSNSGECLDDVAGAPANGAMAAPTSCNGGTGQQWKTLVRANLQTQIQNVSSGLCLKVAGGSRAAGSPVVQWSCNNNPSETWYFRSLKEPTPAPTPTPAPDHSTQPVSTPAAGPKYAVYSSNSNLIINVLNGPLSDGGELVQSSDAPLYASALWTFVPAADGSGSFSMINVNSGKCLDDFDFASENGAVASQYTCNGGANQLWKMIAVADLKVQIQNVASGLCLKPVDGSTTPGSQIVQWQCDERNPSQDWYFQSDSPTNR